MVSGRPRLFYGYYRRSQKKSDDESCGVIIELGYSGFVLKPAKVLEYEEIDYDNGEHKTDTLIYEEMRLRAFGDFAACGMEMLSFDTARQDDKMGRDKNGWAYYGGDIGGGYTWIYINEFMYDG